MCVRSLSSDFREHHDDASETHARPSKSQTEPVVSGSPLTSRQVDGFSLLSAAIVLHSRKPLLEERLTSRSVSVGVVVRQILHEAMAGWPTALMTIIGLSFFLEIPPIFALIGEEAPPGKEPLRMCTFPHQRICFRSVDPARDRLCKAFGTRDKIHA